MGLRQKSRDAVTKGFLPSLMVRSEVTVRKALSEITADSKVYSLCLTRMVTL